MSETVEIYDVTLRDGTQGEDISFSVEGKLQITEKLADLGVNYIEGGWPGSNDRDREYFERALKLNTANAKVSAFSSTRRAGVSCEGDANIQSLLQTGVSVAAIVGKSWDFQVETVLETTEDENLAMISDTVEYLKERMETVFFDAEHFFDGFKANPDYAIAAARAAIDAGADAVVMCDTNGGSMPWEVEQTVLETKKLLGGDPPLGIHFHNDTENGVANTLYAIKNGVRHVQGTMNGYGERCGNANLCSIIPNICFKLGMDCITNGKVEKLYETAHFINELANLNPLKKKAFVGASAFAHKGGLHASAVRKNPETYEHIDPSLVGNRRRVLVSDLSGRANIISKAAEFGVEIDSNDKRVVEILQNLKELENKGYEFERAGASFELLVRKHLGLYKKLFFVENIKTAVEREGRDGKPISSAEVSVKVDEKFEKVKALGNGPVNALDKALREALERFFPTIREMTLKDYKVRVVSSIKGTDSVVRVLVESGDGTTVWNTVGVSENVVEASWKALIDSIDYKLLKDALS
ncbi:MAG: citramalate synthase [Candidatus Mycalebacterium zealandia]|nr:MAG: citramalate synthase [Candidatus Mycalebacterium zealandia]